MTTTAFDVTLLADVQAAAARLSGRIRRTPTYHSAGLSARLGVETCGQGRKPAARRLVQGARLLQQADAAERAELARGVVTVSGGNHAIAVALVAKYAGRPRAGADAEERGAVQCRR